MAIKYFTKQYAGMLPDLFAKKSAFLRAFGGVLQVKDGVTENDTFMELKVSDRSEERRVGKECSEPCRSRWSPYH